MVSPLLKPSFIRSIVFVTYFLVLCSHESLGVVHCVGAPAYPPVENPASAPELAPAHSPVEIPAFTAIPTPAPGPAVDIWLDSGCEHYEAKYQAYEQEAMLSVSRAWKRSGPTKSPSHNISNWNESVHPCDRSAQWSGVACRGTLVNHESGTVCEMFLVGLLLWDTEIIGELVPEIGDLVNLGYISIINNPGLSGPIPATIWSLPNLKSVQFINNSLNGSVVLNTHATMTVSQINLRDNFLTSWDWDLGYSLLFLNTLDLSNNLLSGSFNFGRFDDGCTSGGRFYYGSLTTLDLSNNRLDNLRGPAWDQNGSTNYSPFLHSLLKIGGHLPDWSSMRAPSKLSELYLDKNNITGEFDISAFVESDFSKNLTILSLKDNNITRVVYTDDFAKGVRTRFILQGNPYCNNVWSSLADALRCSIYCEHICVYEKYNKDSDKSWKIIVTATSSSSALLLMFVILCFAIILRRKQKYIRALQKKIKKADINAKRFEYNELRVATKNFAPEMKLGAGAYGAVYKGTLPNNVVVAVKQLFLETNEGRNDFLNEVFLISNLQHRNLVNLKGYCLRGKQTLLVYEYVDNYDLDKLLLSRNNSTHSSSNKQVLNWQAQMTVCQGVAQGLFYLHASSQARIIHRDIKASNILLDKNLQPKIADFGLARPIEDARSVIMTQQCAGTPGYLAPEYMCHGQLSEKADVYSFGVLLQEIVSGKRNRDLTMPEDEVYLPTRAWKLHKENKLLDMKDATLVVSEDEAVEVQQVLLTAVLCVQNTPAKRPSMFQVAAMLAGDANIDVAPIDEYDSWAETIMMDESDSCENPLFTSTASAASSRGDPLTSGNTTIELRMCRTL